MLAVKPYLTLVLLPLFVVLSSTSYPPSYRNSPSQFPWPRRSSHSSVTWKSSISEVRSARNYLILQKIFWVDDDLKRKVNWRRRNDQGCLMLMKRGIEPSAGVALTERRFGFNSIIVLVSISAIVSVVGSSIRVKFDRRSINFLIAVYGICSQIQILIFKAISFPFIILILHPRQLSRATLVHNGDASG